MAIQVQKRPFLYCFSGNPVHYQLYSELASGDDSVVFEIRVMFRNINGAYAPTEALSYSPVNGVASLDIQDILEGLVNYELPRFSVDENLIWDAPAQTGQFYLQFREITNANPDPSWDNAESDHAAFVIKGGISMYKYQGNNYWVNYYGIHNPNMLYPFLTWQLNGRLAAANERMYLLYLNIVGAEVFRVEAKATYVDGSTYTSARNFVTLKKGVCYYIPSGALQWGLVHPAKQLYYWEIKVIDETVPDNPSQISETFTYEADNKNDYNDTTLYYRGSLGGLDSVRVRGVIQIDLDYEFSEQSKVVRPDYFNGHFFDAHRNITNNKELRVWRGDIGHMGKEEQDRLRDCLVKRETWQEKNKKWIPYSIVTKNLRLRASEDTRFKMALDFTLAHEGDTNYTPDSVNLGDGVFTDNVCLARLGPIYLVIDNTNNGLNDGNALVRVDFTEVDPQNLADSFRYRLLDTADNSVVIDWTVLQMADNPFSFVVPLGEIYLLETQAICVNTVYGARSSVQINTEITADPPPVPTSNSRVVNNTGSGSNISIRVNDGADPGVSGYLGAFNEFAFPYADLAAATVEIEIFSFSPSAARLESNGVTYYPLFGFSNVITFFNVNIVNGFTITLD